MDNIRSILRLMQVDVKDGCVQKLPMKLVNLISYTSEHLDQLSVVATVMNQCANEF